MVTSPILGFIGGMMVMTILFAIIRHMRPRMVDRVFGKLQLLSATYMGWSHGFADGQKTMGIMALAASPRRTMATSKHLPHWLGFLYTPTFEIKTWVKCVCGTGDGPRHLQRRLAHHSYAGQQNGPIEARCMVSPPKPPGATLLLVTGKLGMPISTTHAITTAIMGVGCARRFSALNWTLVERILWTWVLTIPATGLIAYGLVWLFQALGWTK